MMGMASGDLAGARSRQQAGKEAMMEGFKDVATSAVDFGLNTGKIKGGVSGQNVTDTQFSNLIANAGPVGGGSNSNSSVDLSGLSEEQMQQIRAIIG